MKRNPALVSLSGDHHKTLVVAQELRRATPPMYARGSSRTGTHMVAGTSVSQLAAHVRLEERELFPLIERTMPTARLAAVAVALEDADRRHARWLLTSGGWT
jgi:hypothetical protein